MEYAILVDEEDREIGQMEKMQGHVEARLHRAFSVFVFNENGDMLIHRRALEKYHSGGLRTNACCSHPRPGDTAAEAAHRRMPEEMGFDCEIHESFSFQYCRELDKGLTENELDHVFTAVYEGPVKANPQEVMAWKYINMAELKKSLQEDAHLYTEWFRIVCLQYWDKITTK